MTIRKHLEAILEGAANRPADQTGLKAAPEKIEDDVTKQGGFGGATGRKADKSGELPAHEGTKITDPTAKIEHGAGTEVQGNTDTSKGLGESISEKIADTLAESVEFKIDLDSMKGLLESQELSEEFQTQAIGIFEAAITDVAQTHLGKLNGLAESLIEAELASALEVMEAEVSTQVQAAIAEWKEENALVIESGIRTQVAESFMSGLADLLEAHNIVLPEEKVDLYDVAIAEGEKVVGAYEFAIAEGEKLMAENAELRKQLALAESIVGMTDVQAEKVKTLAESIEFSDEAAFKAQLKTLTEGYVKVQAPETLTEDESPLIQEEQIQVSGGADPLVAALAEAVRKVNR